MQSDPPDTYVAKSYPCVHIHNCRFTRPCPHKQVTEGGHDCGVCQCELEIVRQYRYTQQYVNKYTSIINPFIRPSTHQSINVCISLITGMLECPQTQTNTTHTHTHARARIRRTRIWLVCLAATSSIPNASMSGCSSTIIVVHTSVRWTKVPPPLVFKSHLFRIPAIDLSEHPLLVKTLVLYSLIEIICVIN